MCLIAWNWQPNSETPLLLLSNRDEFYARPTEALHHWPHLPKDTPILAGRDTRAGGTWLGVGSGGRLAALTNFRSATPLSNDAPSRGELVADFLRSPQDASAYLHGLQQRASVYNPFNLLVYDGRTLLGLESRGTRIVTLQTGIGAVSNADFNAPWPKLRQLTSGLVDCLARGETQDQHLWPLLQVHTRAPDVELPRTGVSLELERALSATFITTPDYGTRACSLVRIGTQGVRFSEQRFGADGALGETTLVSTF